MKSKEFWILPSLNWIHTLSKNQYFQKLSFPQNSYKLYINFSINMGWEMRKIDDAFIFNHSLKRREEKLINILLHWNVPAFLYNRKATKLA